jgi:hypothetical protein
MSRFLLIIPMLLLAAAAPDVPTKPPESKPPESKLPESKLPPTVELHPVGPEEAMPVLGHRVVGRDGNEIARLVDVLVDANGLPVAAVLDFGGFMGVGSRKIAVHWSALHFEPAGAARRVVLSLTPDEIKAAPEYKDPEQPAPVVVPAAIVPKPGP